MCGDVLMAAFAQDGHGASNTRIEPSVIQPENTCFILGSQNIMTSCSDARPFDCPWNRVATFFQPQTLDAIRCNSPIMSQTINVKGVTSVLAPFDPRVPFTQFRIGG